MGSPTLLDGAAAPLLQLKAVTKVYGEGEATVHALAGVDFEVWPGDFVAITGASGSGKTTTVSIIGCLESLTAGDYRIEGVPVQELPPDVLAALRNAKFGFIFQNYNLLSRTTTLENVALPLVYAGMDRIEREARARAALADVGLEGREESRSNQLSGGQQQRVAIARALVNEPEVILADEPTGNLDSKTGKEIMSLISGLNRDRGITVLMVTHDPSCAEWARRRVVFQDGRIISDTRKEAPS